MAAISKRAASLMTVGGLHKAGIMKKLKAVLVVMVSVCLTAATIPVSSLDARVLQPSPVGLSVFAPDPVALAPAAASNMRYYPKWPQTFDKNGVHAVVYQPQVKSWTKYRTLVADSAIALTPAGQKTILGVISWRADTVANTSARTVLVKNIEVLSARFPYLDPVTEAQVQQRIHAVYPTVAFTIGLDRLIASLGKVNDPAKTIAANPEVPKIFVSTTPAIVLIVDGKPVLAPIQGTTLEYVVNTNWDVFHDKTDYYLLNGKMWLKSSDLNGVWTETKKLPAEMEKLPKGQNWDEVLKAVPPPATTGAAPKVFFSDKPAEIIAFKGAPEYVPVSGTNLEYAANTESTVFIHHPDNQIYVLISGRWFRAGSIDAPWVYAGNDLPDDFAKIPPGGKYSAALVAVPGSQAANDAVLLSQVPTTALVNRASAEATVKVVYTGEPQFVPIETTTMYYAVNTPDRVIRVGNAYYLCFQGIWFISVSPSGPWKTADSVPAVIYTIPPSSPVYNVTYVIVSNPTPTTVETSYTAGYLGVFVIGLAVGATIVYGTGYYYPPYIYYGPRYPIYYPYPYTYGCAAVYNPYTGAYGVGRAVYGPYGSVGTAAWYNPTTGTYGRAVTTQNAYGGHTYAQAYNPWTGTYAATSQGHNQYAQWGSSVVTNGNNWAEAQHYTNANGTAGSFQTSKGSEGAGVTGKNGNSAFVAKDANNNNVYAGADGNVYKKDSDGNWSKYSDGGWTPVDPSTGAAQTKKQSQNLSGATQNQTTPKAQTPPSSASGATGSTGSGSRAQGRQSDPSTTPSAGQGRQSQTTPSTAPGSSGSSDTMNQLNNDAGARSRGDQAEQGRGAGAGSSGGRGSSRGSSGGGGGRPRR
jgi:hypothetical protein